MLRGHAFHKGHRVRPSAKGVAAGIFERCKAGATVVGTVKRLNRQGYPVVIWDDRLTEASYHPNFIEIAPPEDGGERDER